MTKRILLSVLLATLLLAFSVPTAALASEGEPIGSCAPNFELHQVMDHSGEHMHHHIGVDQDFNGDGYICMRMLPNDLHLHVDNFLPLP